MPNFKIIQSLDEIQLADPWKRPTTFNCQNRLVNEKGQRATHDYQGRIYKIVEKRERDYSRPKRILRIFLGLLATISTGFTALGCKKIRRLFTKQKETIFYGKEHEKIILTVKQNRIYHQVKNFLKSHPDIKEPEITFDEHLLTVEDRNNIFQTLSDEKLLQACYAPKNLGKAFIIEDKKWYKPEEPALSNHLLDMTPDYLLDLQDSEVDIQKVKEKLLNSVYYSENETRFKSENVFICLVQHFFLVDCIKKLSVNQIEQLLRECNQRNPEALALMPRVQACKNFLESEGYREDRLMIWLFGYQPVFTADEDAHFTDLINLRNTLFLDRPFHQNHQIIFRM